MKTVKKNVYYCEYCNKRSLSAFHMKSHELHCTANINRICGFCGSKMNLTNEIELLKGSFKIVDADNDDLFSPEKVVWTNGKEITIDDILSMTDGCPACTLSVLRLSGMHLEVFGWDWKYEEAKKEYWGERVNRGAYDPT